MASYEEYWMERANRRIADRHKYLDASIRQIQNAYDEAMKELNGDINRLFLRFVKETGLSQTEAKKLLAEKISSKELEKIRSKIDSIEDEDILRQLRQKLEVSYYKNRISRQEALREAIHIQMSVIADKELTKSTSAYTEAIREEYYHNIFDSQQFLGIAFNFVDLPEKVIEQILADDWSGKHYSKRIWGNSQTMAGMIEKIILKGAMKGTNSRKMAQELNKISNAGMYACERLIRTETTYFTAMADLEAAKARGTEKVQFVATLDARTSEECRAFDGKIILVSEAEPGRNIPPLHPFCRSVIIDVIEGLVHKVRRARDPKTGKNYKVPADMTYQQWKVRYNKLLASPDIKNGKFLQDTKTFRELLEENDDGSNFFEMMKVNLDNASFSEDMNAQNAYAYDDVLDEIVYNPNHPEFTLLNSNFTLAHELGHRLDSTWVHSWESTIFKNAIVETKRKFYNNREEIMKTLGTGGIYEKDAAFSDIISALTKGEMSGIVGHSKEYWMLDEGRVAAEIFANLSAMKIMQSGAFAERGGFLKELFDAMEVMV